MFEIEPVRALPRPVKLGEIKAEASLAGWELVRIGRLSVMPVPDSVWKRIESLASK